MAIYLDNIFDAVSADPMEVFDLTLRADLLDTILAVIHERALTPKQLGDMLDIPPSRVSELMRGKIALLTVAKLIGYLGMLGYQFKPAAGRGGSVTCAVRHVEHPAA